MSPVVLWLTTLILFGFGLIGIFIPAIPGLALIVAGIFFYAYVTGFTTISVSTVILFALVALAAWPAEYLGAGLAARAGGGRGAAMIGATIGALVGAFTGPLGIVLGAFIGALAGALIEGHSSEQAGKIALWSVLGIIGVTLVQLLIGLALIIAFFVAVWL